MYVIVNSNNVPTGTVTPSLNAYLVYFNTFCFTLTKAVFRFADIFFPLVSEY